MARVLGDLFHVIAAVAQDFERRLHRHGPRPPKTSPDYSHRFVFLSTPFVRASSRLAIQRSVGRDFSGTITHSSDTGRSHLARHTRRFNATAILWFQSRRLSSRAADLPRVVD